MTKKTRTIISLLCILMLLVSQAGAVSPPALEKHVEPLALTTECGLALADIPETLSVEQTVQASHVEHLRNEELSPNTAVFRNSDGSNTLYIFSEDIWHYNEQGEKLDYTTAIETVNAASDAGAAFKTANGAGVLTFPSTVGASSPIQFQEGDLHISISPSTDRIVFPENQRSAADPLLKPDARVAARAAEQAYRRFAGFFGEL